MKKIQYLTGDATKPIGDEMKILVHVCNDIGGWGKGFVMAISRRWREPEESYRKWHREQVDFKLGEVQYVKVRSDLIIANLIGQHKINKDENGNPPIRYNAIGIGLRKIKEECIRIGATVHMPRIGCGLAGGNWAEVEKIINKELLSSNISVYVYDFK